MQMGVIYSSNMFRWEPEGAIAVTSYWLSTDYVHGNGGLQ